MNNQIPVLTVSQLNQQVKRFLEFEIGLVQVEGEVSNLSKPSSGHFYFTLKDSSAQLRCVFFKNRHTGALSNKLSDGQLVIATGRLSLYEARGEYQLIIEQLTDAGFGALYQRFEALKTKLAAQGLFNQDRKKTIPTFPTTIGIISSPSGAALQDILSTLGRRYPLAKVLIYPSEVQGTTAHQQLIKALKKANSDKKCEVLILARGGGSIEDLWAFNDEQLALTIAASNIPIVSGVGHETDFTIADFVADYRAETPTAAATAVTPDCMELQNYFAQTLLRLQAAITRIIQQYRITVGHIMDKLSSPEKSIASYWQRLDYLERQLHAYLSGIMGQKRHQLHLNSARLHLHNPKTQINQTQVKMAQIRALLIQHISTKVSHLKYQLTSNLATLHAVSPLATLDRGYAIASTHNKALFSVEHLQIGDLINIRLAQGRLE
ncbi:MAG: exodeoxyribonuclease VII large subunit, partial [Legionellales bacterium]